MKHRCPYYRDWMEWRDPRRYGEEASVVLTREFSVHLARPLGRLVTFEDAARVRAEGEASHAAAVQRVRAHLAKVKRRLRKAKRLTSPQLATNPQLKSFD